MTEAEGTVEGTTDGTGTGQPLITEDQDPAWLAQMPAELRKNPEFTSRKTIGALGYHHLEVLGKMKELDTKKQELEAKLTNYVPKLTEDATDEEKEVFWMSMGKPEGPKDYVIPKPEGGEQNPEVVAWAQNTFYSANLTRQQAELIGKEFNTFVDGLVKAEVERKQNDRAKAEEALKQEWGDKYEGNLELTSRAWKKFTDQEIKAFLEEEHKGPIGNHPMLIKFLYNVGKAMGDDKTPRSSQFGDASGGKISMQYPDMAKKA